MALDGLVISNLTQEFNNILIDGRINKINQPESDELLLVIKNNRTQYKLLLSANASYPLAYITEESKTNPLTAPNFCMLLRKHLNSAKIVSITQPDFERIIDFKIEHLNELGDICYKHLIIELMGKHSNIIFTDDQDNIIDSIKRINSMVSSIRTVLPGFKYFIPKQQGKINPLSLDYDMFLSNIKGSNQPIYKHIYLTYTGISPLVANEICHRASLNPDTYSSELNDDVLYHLYNNFNHIIQDIKNGKFTPNIVYNGTTPIEYSSIHIGCYSNYSNTDFQSISGLLFNFYHKREVINRINQKSADIRKIVSTTLERTYKKYDLQQKQMKDTDKKEKYKIYGELLTTYGYSIETGSKSATVNNYYTNEDIAIPLDPTLSPIDNAKKYFNKYNKLKRTYIALEKQLEETKDEIEHLESISNALDIARLESDLADIKEELIATGYIKNKHRNVNNKQKKARNKSLPLHYLSSDGYHIYVGKNNAQNDELTFKFASNSDWWFHAKGMAGSHVIVKSNGEELPDRVFEEAGMLAAYYSKAKDQQKVEIDYIQRKHIKKPNNAKPGFVIYHTNYSLVAIPDISTLIEL
ncbi:MAG: fibronectin/fibrinogen-binding protein [Lachnospiraceae bacterium]|nr:fibronectin/fibrinogen-binding protein [Lachnospiraceae bacterium]